MLKYVLFTIVLTHTIVSAAYISWILGNPGDYVLPDESILDGGIVLGGGGTDQDEAMQWFLRKAHGGDVIVFRNARNATSTSVYPTADAYNPYFFSELGVKVDSVETVFLNSRDVANDAQLAQKVRQAEAIFFTGGDQAFYWVNIKNTLLELALDYVINVKKVAIGGTSAGTAVQGEYLFSAELDTITTSEALNDPYSNKLTIRDNLFKHRLLADTITDTHYNNPDRRGRHLAFMARVLVNNPTKVSIVKGIGVEEKTAVCIESTGKAYVYSTVGANAHFISQYRLNEGPEVCKSGSKLDWYRGREALQVFKVPGNRLGDKYFDLKTWKGGVGWARGVFTM